MVMTNKEKAIALIKSLPDEVTWEEIHARVWFRVAVQEGLDDVNAGRVLTHEEVKQRMEKWLTELRGRPEQTSTSRK